MRSRKGDHDMATEKLKDFLAYQKALVLFDLVVDDMKHMHHVSDTQKLRSQQVASADSICSNMEEGAGRWSDKEFCHYLVISRGSAAETSGRYRRMQQWLPKATVPDRIQRCNEIIAILTTTIVKFKKRQA